MRYINPTFLESTLLRGKSLEQFFGGIDRGGERRISWLEIRPHGSLFEVWALDAVDTGDMEHLDFYEFANEVESPLVVMQSPSEALSYAQLQLGAVSTRWVNESVSQDEYKDFIIAGRPSIWPVISQIGA